MKTVRRILCLLLLLSTLLPAAIQRASAADDQHYLYVAVPGIRNETQWGGIGVLVFDRDHEHRFVRRIPTWEAKPGVAPEAVKGICASAKTGRLYVGTTARLLCIDLRTEKPLWEKSFTGGCDRMAIAPDGKLIYLPSLEGPFWNVVNAETGDLISKVETNSGSHNTIYGPNGAFAYLAGLKSPLLFVSDTHTHTVAKTIGPFDNVIRPFTINRAQTLCFVNVNDLLGFEVGDLKTGKKLWRVEVSGVQKGETKRHGCPSHGIGLTPDEKEVWVMDSFNSSAHIFDATSLPPKQVARISLRDQPGWITFSMDGRYAYPSTGEVIDIKTRRIVTTLADENGHPVQSEKMVEINLRDGKPFTAGDQFGIGRKR